MISEKSIYTLVIGDVNVDVVLAPVAKYDPTGLKWQTETQYREFRRSGGAWLVHEIVTAATGGKHAVWTYSKATAKAWREQLRPPCPVSVATIKRYPRDAEPSSGNVYRMDQMLLGWMRPALGSVPAEAGRYRKELENLLYRLHARGGPDPELVIIHDHNNGFRDLDPADSLEPFLADNAHFASAEGAPPPRGIVLWHTDHPLCCGNLWEFLTERVRAQTIAVVNVEDLREHGIFLKEDLSLEATACDFLLQLKHAPFSALAGLLAVAVRFSNGVMLYSQKGITGGGESLFLSFLPGARRGGGIQGADQGMIVGYTLLLVSALARGIHWALGAARGRSHEEWLALLETGIRSGTELGLAYGQMHFREGFLKEAFESAGTRDRGAAEPHPYRTLIDHFLGRLNDPPHPKELLLASIPFDIRQLRNNPDWSRVALLGHGDEVLGVGHAIVERGLEKVLEQSREADLDEPQWRLVKRVRFPYFKAGDLLLVDRHEVDSFESISTLISNYLRKKDVRVPLSVAVFGPPGSGKSFSVKQLLKKAQHGNDVKTLDFNLAQFQDFRDLAKAFHVVQDKGLREKVPFVFFDEFDTNYGREDTLGWLKYFLAPMQDGKFRDGETTYQVGRAILFFAGGTHATFQDFYDPARDEEDPVFKAAKVPDFVSRLRGFLNIPGINTEKEVDDVTIIRRAILLRAFIEKHCQKVIDPHSGVAKVDRGVVRAFLLTKLFEHGVRSMEAIVEMAAVSISRGSFQKASLPLESQLKMHVDAKDFLVHVHSVPT
jgi:hypothetical protein